MTRIHQVKGRDLNDALERARDAVGERAVVLSQRTAAGGVTLAVADTAPRTKDELSRLRGRARAILAHSPEVGRVPKPRPSTAEVEERLRMSGTSQRLTERVLEAVAGRADEGRHPLDLAGDELGAIFSVAQAKMRRGTTTIFALLGAPGAGKTTTAAKLALRLSKAGKRVAIVTTDTHRVGSVEQTKALGKHIGCTTIALRDPAKLAQALASAEPAPDVVLIDTTGRPAEDGAALDRLAEALALENVEAQLVRFLVLPASANNEALARACATATCDGCVVTRLDETERPAPVLEQALSGKLPVAFLCDGPAIDAHLHRATESVFADLLLRGRIAR
ncbi:MAG: hypothetical protein O2816_00040 [Planctomycetota bacterium]|nr:hypothetical protein [Planctomycetota bacterium]